MEEGAINTIIARRVMGWTLKAKDPVPFPGGEMFCAHWWFNAAGQQVHRDVAWDPWRNLDDAFEVFAKLPPSWRNVSQLPDGKWTVKKFGSVWEWPDCQGALIEPTDTLPAAICLAALKLVGVTA